MNLPHTYSFDVPDPLTCAVCGETIPPGSPARVDAAFVPVMCWDESRESTGTLDSAGQLKLRTVRRPFLLGGLHLRCVSKLAAP